MRRWLALLLLACLPLQFSWAAVAVYCAHGAEAGQTSHVGHHDHDAHVHGGGHADADAATGASGTDHGTDQGAGKATQHLDCGHCHGTCAVVTGLPTNWALPLPCQALPPSGEAAWPEPAPALPERPQWQRLA